MPANEPHNIALWGPPAAGKTMFLAQLYLRSHHDGAEWEVFAKGPALDFIDRNRALVDSQNKFIPRTDPGTSDQKVLYEFCHKQSEKQLLLSIDDRAGGDWITMDEKEEMQEVYGSAAALILLFDCTAAPEKLRTTVLRTLERVRVAQGSRSDPRPVAFCLSKADSIIHSALDLTEATSHPDSFMRRWMEQSMGRHFLEEVAKFFHNYRLFPISSIGVRFMYGVRQPIVFFDEKFEQRLRFGRELVPVNLFAPITWLFEHLEADHGD